MKIGLLLPLIACLAVVFTSCKKAPPPGRAQAPKQPVISQGIQGTATIDLRMGNTNALEGLELVLCRPEAEKAVIETRDTKWLEKATPREFGNGYKNLDLVAMGRTALRHEVQRTTTDSLGKYTLADTPPGNYIVYGQYKSRYAAGYWLVPVTVSEEKVTTLDLSNVNMKEIHNSP